MPASRIIDFIDVLLKSTQMLKVISLFGDHGNRLSY